MLPDFRKLHLSRDLVLVGETTDSTLKPGVAA